MEHVRDILAKFEIALGQKINLAKSSLYFSANTPSKQKTLSGIILGMQIVDNLDNYLGLPLHVRKNKNKSFRFLLDRFVNRIKGWSKRLLSRERKEVFSKAILQSLPTYPFSMFLLPRGLIKILKAKARSF